MTVNFTKLFSPVAFAILLSLTFNPRAFAENNSSVPGRITANASGDDLSLKRESDERIQVTVSRSRGLFMAPLRVQVNDREVSLGGFYVHLNHLTNGFFVENT